MLSAMRGALAIICVLAGCGDNAAPALDAAIAVDAVAVDAAPDAPGSGTVRVRAWIDASWRGVPPAPRPDTQVWVNAPDGTPTVYALTGAGGDVVVPVLPGSTVSVVFPRTPRWDPILTSYVGVQPGITLDFAEYWRGDYTEDAQFAVEVPPHPNATSYVAQTPFNTQAHFATSFTVKHDTSVAPVTSIDELLVLARGAGGGVVAAGLISPLDVAQTPVVLAAWQEAPLHEVQATGIPGSAIAEIRAWTFRRGRVQEGSAATPVDGVAQLRVSPIADRVVTSVSIDEGLQHEQYRAVSVGSEPGAPGATFDFGALVVGPIDGLSVDESERTVRWSHDGSRPHDVSEVVVFNNDVSWELLVPPGQDQVVLPQLPAELAAYEPQGPYSAQLMMRDASGWAGYADVLATVPWERGRRVELGDASESVAIVLAP